MFTFLQRLFYKVASSPFKYSDRGTKWSDHSYSKILLVLCPAIYASGEECQVAWLGFLVTHIFAIWMANEIKECVHIICRLHHRTIKESKAAQFKQLVRRTYLAVELWPPFTASKKLPAYSKLAQEFFSLISNINGNCLNPITFSDIGKVGHFPILWNQEVVPGNLLERYKEPNLSWLEPDNIIGSMESNTVTVSSHQWNPKPKLGSLDYKNPN